MPLDLGEITASVNVDSWRLPATVKKADVVEALRLLGIMDLRGLTSVHIGVNKVTVEYLRVDAEGRHVAGGSELMRQTTEIGIDWTGWKPAE